MMQTFNPALYMQMMQQRGNAAPFGNVPSPQRAGGIPMGGAATTTAPGAAPQQQGGPLSALAQIGGLGASGYRMFGGQGAGGAGAIPASALEQAGAPAGAAVSRAGDGGLMWGGATGGGAGPVSQAAVNGGQALGSVPYHMADGGIRVMSPHAAEGMAAPSSAIEAPGGVSYLGDAGAFGPLAAEAPGIAPAATAADTAAFLGEVAPATETVGALGSMGAGAGAGGAAAGEGAALAGTTAAGAANAWNPLGWALLAGAGTYGAGKMFNWW